MRGLLSGAFFDEGNFGGGEVVELIDELVDLAVGGFDLALEDGVGVAGFGGGEVGLKFDLMLSQ